MAPPQRPSLVESIFNELRFAFQDVRQKVVEEGLVWPRHHGQTSRDQPVRARGISRTLLALEGRPAVRGTLGAASDRGGTDREPSGMDIDR